MEAQFTLTSLDKNTVTCDLGAGASPAESSFYAAGYGDFIAVEHHTMKSFGVKYAPVSAVTVNGQTFTTDADAVKAINALDIFPEHYVVDSSDPRVDGIVAVIPSTATPENPLVDTDKLNSSISHIAANQVTYDAAGNGFPTKAALLAATVFYHRGVEYTPTNNDYCVVISDESAPARFLNGQTRYLYDGSVWNFSMGINEAPMTAAQLAALDSGITAAKRQTYDGYASQLIGQPAFEHYLIDPNVGSLWSYRQGSIYSDSVDNFVSIYLNGAEVTITHIEESLSIPQGSLVSVYCYGWETTFIITATGRFMLINERVTA